MEILVFIALVVIVGIVLLARARSGGTRARPFGRPRHLRGGPIGYGQNVAPPGTSRGASVNAPWFGRDHSRGDKSGGAS